VLLVHLPHLMVLDREEHEALGVGGEERVRGHRGGLGGEGHGAGGGRGGSDRACRSGGRGVRAFGRASCASRFVVPSRLGSDSPALGLWRQNKPFANREVSQRESVLGSRFFFF